jgi:hypothetical protein
MGGLSSFTGMKTNTPTFNHYVPRFYLRKFTNPKGHLWVYDKWENKTFKTQPNRIAGQHKFYYLEDFARLGVDPLTMEKQFADIEHQAKNIFECWEKQFKSSTKLEIPTANRELISLYITLQLLRTVEAKEQFIQFINKTIKANVHQRNATSLHTQLLWDKGLVKNVSKKIFKYIWIFAINQSKVNLLTSDHPITIKTFDNKKWVLGPRVFDYGMYIVFPLSPRLIMYIHEQDYWKKLKKFANCLSPVRLNDYMVNHENSGQIGMSYRFIFSNKKDFDFAKEYLDANPEFKNPNRERFTIKN